MSAAERLALITPARRLDPKYRYPELHKRFLARVEVDLQTGCWEWTGHLNWNDYGKLGGKWAHRVGYEIFVGPIPDGLHLDHLCRNKRCVYHGHLEPVTQAENNRRQWRARGLATACRRGHDRSVHGYRNGQGYTTCRECERLRHAAARKAVAA